MLKKIVYLLIFVLVIAAIGYAVLLNLPKASVEGKQVDVSLDVSKLFAAYEQDEKTADLKFIGKIMDVTGRVGGIEKDEAGRVVVILDSGNGVDGVLCTMESGQTEAAKAIQPGDELKIRGICTGKMMDVVLNKCILLE